MVNNVMTAKRVSGQQLGQHLDSEIVLIGQIKQVAPHGKSVTLLTTDNVTVNVSLPEPIDGNCEGFMEVYGTAQSKSTVSVKTYIHFPPEMSTDFESEKYNAFLSTLLVIGDKKWKINADEDPY